MFALSKSQNLVPNPSFESYTLCPGTSGGQIESALPWTAATAISSTDYFNACSSVSAAGVPYHQGGGFQYAKTGNAYAGLLFTVGSGSGREYLQVQLTSLLIQNVTYYVEFYVNSASFTWTSSSCNNIAANLSTNKPIATGTELLLIPHIMISGNPIINDTLNWIKVSGCYTAQGGEEYLTIGNFFNNANTQTTGGNGVSYYYIDDVLVEEITGTCVTGINELSTNFNIDVYPNPTDGVLNLKLLDAGKDVEIKITDVLGKEVFYENYKTEIDISFLESGIYFVSVYKESQLLGTKKIVKQ